MTRLRYFFWVVDVGFIAYWVLTFLAVIPEEYLFKDYHDPILMAWNWSFLPLDLCISATGLASLRMWHKGVPQWRSLAIVSLTLTSCSGLQAVAFWALRSDFDPVWWALNLFLLLYPIFFLPALVGGGEKTVENQGRNSIK